MIRFLLRSLLTLLANGIGLFVANVLFDKLTINFASFAVAVVIFTLATIILGPFILKISAKHAPYLAGGIALVTTFVGLVVTTIVSDGISISGWVTWVSAAFVVWLFSIIANVVLPMFLFKQALSDQKNN